MKVVFDFRIQSADVTHILIKVMIASITLQLASRLNGQERELLGVSLTGPLIIFSWACMYVVILG